MAFKFFTDNFLGGARTRPTAEEAAQLPSKPLRREPISQKRKDVPRAGRAIPECPMEESRKRGVRSLPGRARADGTKTKAAIGTLGDDRSYALEPAERNRP